MQRYDADSILWNWARWCASGERVGNMLDVVPHCDDEEALKPVILPEQAEQVDRLHKTLPHHEQMIIIAEYPQRHGFFRGLPARQRREKAQRWIKDVTGVWIQEPEYKLYLGLFKELVWREVV